MQKEQIIDNNIEADSDYQMVDNDVNVFPLASEEILIQFMDISDTIALELRKQVRQGKINHSSGKLTRALFRKMSALTEQYRRFSK